MCSSYFLDQGLKIIFLQMHLYPFRAQCKGIFGPSSDKSIVILSMSAFSYLAYSLFCPFCHSCSFSIFSLQLYLLFFLSFPLLETQIQIYHRSCL